MTAQPEVMWVYPYGTHWKVCQVMPAFEDAIPMVPQSALTAALAERDKLAKALAEATKLLGTLHEEGPWDEYLNNRVGAFLTAQAAQGDGGNA